MWCAGPDKLSWYSSHAEQHCPVEIYRVRYSYVGNFTFPSSHVKTKQKNPCRVSYLFLCNILPRNLAATTTDMYYPLVSVGRGPKSSLAGSWNSGPLTRLHLSWHSRPQDPCPSSHVVVCRRPQVLISRSPQSTQSACVCSQRWAPHCPSLCVSISHVSMPPHVDMGLQA